jgi:hypothetical protein
VVLAQFHSQPRSSGSWSGDVGDLEFWGHVLLTGSLPRTGSGLPHSMVEAARWLRQQHRAPSEILRELVEAGWLFVT